MAYGKYVLGRPLHRIIATLAADGLDVAEGTLAGTLDPSRVVVVPAAVPGIDRGQAVLEAGRRLVISSGFYGACQSLAAVEDP